jgi:hypothetical protein
LQPLKVSRGRPQKIKAVCFKGGAINPDIREFLRLYLTSNDSLNVEIRVLSPSTSCRFEANIKGIKLKFISDVVAHVGLGSVVNKLGYSINISGCPLYFILFYFHAE